MNVQQNVLSALLCTVLGLAGTGKSLGASPSTTLRGGPVVAVHDSESTRALETMVATNLTTPTGPGTSGFEWWPTNWHYFVMPESVKEALSSDGTAFEVVTDADISAGRLLDTNGQPRYPIMISLAAEAVQDDEIAQLTNYVAAGGTLLIGSSSFTRFTNGAIRGDFALADQMGLHAAGTNAQNWSGNSTVSKIADHRLVSHIPGGVLSWHMPSSAEETLWGVSPDHLLPATNLVWRVQASDATVIAQGDTNPFLAVKQYGKGGFIYHAGMQPLIAHGGFSPGMYAYAIFRQAIEGAFASNKLPLPRLSAWPYPYDAALSVRHDLEDFQDLIGDVESSAAFESANGVKGDYYFCTGTLRVEMTNSAAVIAGLRRAVTNYGATIGPHNGGLKNPNNTNLSVSSYDYWHWGPDEALNVTPAGYPSGKAYALASVSNAFQDVEGWLIGVTNGLRSWVSPYFNATREDSYDLQEQLGVKTAGEQKLSPFPHWTLSTLTPNKRYSFLTLPASDWFVGTQIGQAMETGHNSATMHACVDFYYGMGALINLYSHSLSDGTGMSGGLVQDYITYSMTKPRLLPANAAGIYSWWLKRQTARVVPSYTTSSNQSITTLAISGASDPQTTVEVLVPQPRFSGLQVITNGVLATGGAYRTNGQLIKVLAGATVTNAEVRYILNPVTQDDSYSAGAGEPLTVPAPGVLSNDEAGLGTNLSVVLVGNPSHGTLSLDTNGALSYTPATNFFGVDSFTYQVNDGVSDGNVATVTIIVNPDGRLFADDFARLSDPGPLSPWLVQSGSWAVSSGILISGLNPLSTYGNAYIANTWSNYSVQARLQFPAGAFGGGLGGCLNPVTGSHYAAWIYPEGSPGGSNVLKLIKFQTWTTFGYDGTAFASMGEANLASVGTNFHTVKMVFQGNNIRVSLDGTEMINITDSEAQPYSTGGISADMWTHSASYRMTVDDVLVAVNPADQTIAFGSLPNKTYGDAPFTLSANASSGLPVTFGVVSGSASIENGTVNLTGAGPVTVRAAQAGSGSYKPAPYVDQSFNILPATLGVIAVNQSRTYGSPNPTLTASYSGFVNGNDSNVLNGSPDLTTTAGVTSPLGAYPIVAAAGSLNAANYTFAFSDGSLTVTPHPLNVTADNQSRTYGAANPTLTGTVTGIQNGDPISATYGTTADFSSPVATYAIVPALSGPLANYSVTANNGTLSITPAALTGSTDDKSRLYGAPNPAFTVTYSGFVNGENASLITGTLIPSTTAETNSPVGAYPITASGQSAPNYTIQYLPGTLTVTAAPLLVTATDASRAYGQTNPVFSATVSGLVNGEQTNGLGGVLELTTTAQTNSPIGTYPIMAAGLTSTNYDIIFSNGTLTVSAYALTVTADNQSRSYGAANPVLTGTITGIQNGDLISASYSTTADTNSPVGGYGIVPALSGPLANYSVTINDGTLAVTAATLIVTADNQSRAYGAANPDLTGTISGIRNGDSISATYSTTADLHSPVGGYGIVPALSGPLGNYSIITNNGTLTLTAATLIVTADSQSRTYGAANPTLTGTVTGIQNGDAISTSYSTAADANSPVGAYSIVPALSGPLANYSVTANNGTLSITPAALTGSTDDKSRLYGAPNPAFTVTYSGFVNGENASLITGTLIPSTTAETNSPVGAYPITASGQSAPNYTIQYLPGTLTVTAAPLLVTATDASRAYGQTNPLFSATISGLVNGEQTNLLGGVLELTTTAQTNSPIGTYPIMAAGLTSTNYDIIFSNGTLTVSAYALTVTADNQSRSYGAANPVLTGTITGIQNGDLISASYSTTADTNSPVGGYGIVPALSGPLANYSVTINDGTLAVTAATLIVTADNQSRAYGAANPDLTGTISGIRNGDSISATYSTTADLHSPVGGYGIVPALSGPLGNYSIITNNGTLTLTAATLIVTADNQSRTYGAANPTLTGTVTGIQNGDPISATYGTTADFSSPVDAYAIIPTLSGPLANYSVTANNGTLSITPAALTGSTDDKSRLYGAPNPAFTVTYSGFVNGENASLITGTLIPSTTAETNSPVGAYPITASGQSAPNYTIQYLPGTLTVVAAPLLVTATDASRAYGQTNPLFSATISGLVNGEQTNLLGGVLELTTTAQTNSPIGTYPIMAAGLTSTNYDITFSNGTLTVSAYALTVTADDQSRSYGTINPLLTGTITGIQNGDLISATYSTTADTNSPVGGYGIVPALSGPLGNYSITTNNGTLAVTAATLIVTADNQSRAYGAANPTLTGTITGIQNGDAISASYSTTADTNSPVGGYGIVPALSGPLGNYSIITNNGTLTVTAATLIVTADNQSRTYGAANPTLTGTVTGIQNGDPISATYGTTADFSSPVDAYAIIPTLSGPLANYSVTANNGTLSITPAALTGSTDDKSRLYGAPNPAFTVTYSGFVNGENASLITGTLIPSTTAETNSPVGAYPITASGQSAPNYTIQYLPGTLTVTAAPLLVTATDASRAYGQTNPLFSATISGLVNGEQTNLLGGVLELTTTAQTNSPIGTYPIMAAGLTSTNYDITFSNGTLTVSAYALTVTADDQSRSYGTINPLLTGTITGIQNGDLISATYSTTADTNSPVGGYGIVPALSGPLGNYSITTNNGTLAVTAATLIVTADNQSRAYGAANPTLTGTITGIQNGDAISASYSTTADTNSPVGGYGIVPALSGPLGNYSIITNNGTLTVTAATLIVTADNQSRTYGAANPTLTGTVTGIQNGDPISATYGTTADFSSPVDAYAIIPTLSGPLANYSVTANNGTLSITPAALTGSTDDKSRLYGAPNPAFTVTYSGFVNGENASLITGTLIPSTTAETNSPVGAYPITASGQSAPNYTIQYLPGTLTVTAAPLLVTATDASRAYGQTNPVFSATVSGLVNGEQTNGLGGVLELTTTAQTNSPIGTYPIMAAGLTSTNYDIIFSNGTLTVSAYALTVTADNQSRSYGTTNPLLTGTITGIQNGDPISATYNTTADTNSSLGSYPIIPALAGPLGNYSITTNNGTLTVTAATLTVSADNQFRTYGAANPILTGSIVGIQNSDAVSATYSTTADTSSPVGAYAIVPALSGPLSNYAISTNTGTLNVTPANSANALVSSQNPSTEGSSVTFTATITPIPPATTTPSGAVQFFNNGVALGEPVLLSGGAAIMITGTLPMGSNNLSAAYAGDANFLGSTNGLVQVVEAAAVGPGNVSLGRNSDGTMTLSFTGTPGADYLLQATDSLPAVWRTISTNTAAVNGLVVFIDLDATNHPACFYRAARP